MKTAKTLTDLQKFKGFFGMDTHREYDSRLEYRVQDLDGSLNAAREIIRKNNLNVEAKTSGQMAQIRMFEVKEVSNG